ncbi:MAG: hypothetical protein SFX73_10540, partial [Kofleriaceae bacterium]|nr:hypothetical protein [Kofleriaceae bacterium]
MPTRRLIVLALLMGCRSEPTSAPDPVPAVPVEPVAALAAKVTTQLTDGELERVASTLAAVRYDDHARELSPAEIKARQHQLAPLVAHDILAAWETIRSSELTSAEERGVDRARGLGAPYSCRPRGLAWVSAE